MSTIGKEIPSVGKEIPSVDQLTRVANLGKLLGSAEIVKEAIRGAEGWHGTVGVLKVLTGIRPSDDPPRFQPGVEKGVGE